MKEHPTQSIASGKYILVLTISSVEYTAVCKQLELARKEYLKRYDGTNMPGISAKAGGFEGYSIIAICCYRAGNQRITTALNAALYQYRPALVLFVGVAGGVGRDLPIGSVVISDYVADHTFATENREGATNYAFGGGPVAPELIPLAHTLRNSEAWKNRIKQPEQVAEEPIEQNIVIGKISAGNVLVEGDQGPLSQALAAAGHDTHAIEMESAACYDSAYVCNGVPFIAVRGISDRLNDKNPSTDKYRQPWAAAHASAAAFELIHRFIEEHQPEPTAGAPKKAEAAKAATVSPAPAIAEPVDQFWRDIAVLHKFGKLPLLNRGSIVRLIVRFDGTSSTTSIHECKALGLDYGATLDQKITLIKPDVGKTFKSLFQFDFLSKIYATYETAEWLEEADSSISYLVALRLEFGEVLVRTPKIPAEFRRSLPSFMIPDEDEPREHLKYIAGMVLVGPGERASG